MKTLKTTLLSIAVICSVTSCGGGDNATGGAPGTQTGGAPSAPQFSGDPNWEQMSIPGKTVAFEMPKPVKMNADPNGEAVLYVSRKGKMEFRVSIQKRNAEQDRQKGMTDEQVLTNYANSMIQATSKQFESMGFKPQYKFDGNFKVDTGIGQQYETQVGKATVMDRYYINDSGLYGVEVTTQDVNSPDVQQFLNSFRP